MQNNLYRQTDRQTGISSDCSNCLKGIFSICGLYIISISIVAYFITQHLEAFYKYLGISQLHVFSFYQGMVFMRHYKLKVPHILILL